MIEPIMFFGIGFLVASLIGLVILPLVHARAVRLTARRLETATPVSMAEIRADKDQLRAEFAMSTRRLEMSVEQLKGKTTSQLAELGKKRDAINRLEIELGERAPPFSRWKRARRRSRINCTPPRSFASWPAKAVHRITRSSMTATGTWVVFNAAPLRVT